MTNPRQLAPTVGLAHGGVEFLEGSPSGIEKLANFLDEEESLRKDLHYLEDTQSDLIPIRDLRLR